LTNPPSQRVAADAVVVAVVAPVAVAATGAVAMAAVRANPPVPRGVVASQPGSAPHKRAGINARSKGAPPSAVPLFVTSL